MFFSHGSQLRRCKDLIIYSNRLWSGKLFTFIFYEDMNDFRTINNIPYEMHNDNGAQKNETLTIVIVDGLPVRMRDFFIVLYNTGGLLTTGKLAPNMQLALYYTMWNKNTIFLKEVTGPSSIMPLSFKIEKYDLFYQSDGGSYSPLFFLQTFQPTLWISYLGFAVLIMTWSWIANKLMARKNATTIKIFDFIALVLGNSIKCVTGIFSYRVLLISFLLLLIIFQSSFGAFLEVLLAIKRTDLPFNSINEMIANNEYTVCADNLSVIADNLRYLNGNVTILSDKCPEIDKNTNHWTFDFTYRCKAKKLIFFFPLHQRTSIENYLVNSCNLEKFPGKFFNLQSTVLTGFEFTMHEILNEKIIKAWSSGIIDYITHKNYLPITHNFEAQAIHGHVPIEFDHCKLIILILVIGFIMSLVMLTLEIWHAKLNQNDNVQYF